MKRVVSLLALSLATSVLCAYSPEYWDNKESGATQFPPSSEQWDSGSEDFEPGSQTFEQGAETFDPGANQFQPSSEWYQESQDQDQTAAEQKTSEVNVFPQGPDYYGYPEQSQDASHVLDGPEQEPVPTIQDIIDESTGTGEVPQKSSAPPPQGQGAGSGKGGAKPTSDVSALKRGQLEQGIPEVRAKEIYPLNTDTPIMEILYNQLSPQGKQMWVELPPKYREYATELAQQDNPDSSFYNLNDPDQYVEKALEVYQSASPPIGFQFEVQSWQLARFMNDCALEKSSPQIPGRDSPSPSQQKVMGVEINQP